MLKIIIAALVCLFNFLALTNAVRVYCNHPENIRQDHIHFCCTHPDGHNDITEACAKQTGFKLPGSNEEAVEDATVEQVMIGLCWAECVFNKFGFLKHQKELDMNAVRKYYNSTHFHDPEYMKEMIDAFDHCHGMSETATSNFINRFESFNSGTHCQPQPSVILSCVIYNFFHNCPTQRWAHTTECMDTLKFAKKCKDALTNM